MAKSSYEEIIRKAVGFIQANLSKPISIPDVAKAVFYSPDHLRRVFRQVTGHGVLPYLLNLRLNQACKLLRDTDLSVSEISLSTGFNNLAYFSTAFKRMAGMSPMQYRAALRKSGADANQQPRKSDSAEVFRDALTGSLSPWWAIAGGEWKGEAGYVEGQGTDYFELHCLRRLPENCRIHFEAYFVEDPKMIPSDLAVRLTDEGFGGSHIQTVIGTHRNIMGRMDRTGMSSMWNPQARIRPGTWQQFALELKDDMLEISWDGRQIFSFRDPFPGAYSTRCRMAIGSWKSIVRFRDVAISDLGIQPMVRAVRQGDMLFNEGLYERAHDFYHGLLESREASFNSMELHYKLGMCFLRRGLLTPANEWFAKVVTSPENDFWSQVARIAETEAIWESGDMAAFRARIELLSGTPLLRDGLRELLDRICADLNLRGFYQQLGKICEMRIMLEKDSILRINPQYGLADALGQLNRFQEAEALLREIEVTHSSSIYARFALVDAYSFQATWEESNSTIKEIEALSQEQSELALCAIYRARNLRGQGQTEEALSMLNNIPSRFPLAPNASTFAQLIASLTYCAAGDSVRARNAIEEARKIDPTSGYFAAGEACRFTYVPDLLEKNLAQAANCLMHGGEAGRGLNSARYLIYAGIIYALATNADAAAKAYERVVRLYPASRYCYYATLAEALQRGDYKVAFDMPYPAQFRSEMFYLLGLLCEAKGRRNESLEFFRHSLAEDPTLSWPAALARQSLLL